MRICYIDLARGMIGHHQGAIDMARIVLEHGKDFEAQQGEFALPRDWLAEHEGSAPE